MRKIKSVTCTLSSTVTEKHATGLVPVKKEGSVEELKGDRQLDMGVSGHVGDGQIDIELDRQTWG